MDTERGRLSAREEERLAQFAAAFEHVGAREYAVLTPPLDDKATRDALLVADGALGHGRRRQAVRSAIAEFLVWATHAYAKGQGLPGVTYLDHSIPGRPEDRVRFLASLERAVLAIVLWEELTDDDLGALLGPWGPFVEGAGIG